MHSETAVVLTILALCYAMFSGLFRRWCLAPALIFVASGALLGRFGIGLVNAGEHTAAFTVLAQLALTVILFNQACALDLRALLRGRRVALRLLTVGIPVTVALGTVTAVTLLPLLPFWEAVCLAVIVAPTEVAMVHALVEDRRIPEPVRDALSVESGFYDGFALAALLAALAFASERTDHAPGYWAWFAIRAELLSVGVGAIIGLIGATVISRSTVRGWMSDTWAQLATVALALVCFGIGERMHASGFVTAFAGGLAYATVLPRSELKPATTQVSDAAGELLELLVFALFGSFAVIPAWREVRWPVVVFAVVALFVVRVAAVIVALVGSGVPVRSRIFMGWFGPRGIGSLVLGLLVVEQGNIHQGALIKQAVVVVVTISLLIHSLTAPVGIRLSQPRDTRVNMPFTQPPQAQLGDQET